MQMADGEGDERAEDGRRIAGVRQPVLVEMADASVREAVEEVLVLVRVVERRLPIERGKRRGTQQEQNERPQRSSGGSVGGSAHAWRDSRWRARRSMVALALVAVKCGTRN